MAARNAPSTLPVGLVKASVGVNARSMVLVPASKSMNSSPRVAAAFGIGAWPCIASQDGPDRSAIVSSLMPGSDAGKEMVMRLRPLFEGTPWPAGDPRHGVNHG